MRIARRRLEVGVVEHQPTPAAVDRRARVRTGERTQAADCDARGASERATFRTSASRARPLRRGPPRHPMLPWRDVPLVIAKATAPIPTTRPKSVP